MAAVLLLLLAAVCCLLLQVVVLGFRLALCELLVRVHPNRFSVLFCFLTMWQLAEEVIQKQYDWHALPVVVAVVVATPDSATS